MALASNIRVKLNDPSTRDNCHFLLQALPQPRSIESDCSRDLRVMLFDSI